MTVRKIFCSLLWADVTAKVFILKKGMPTMGNLPNVKHAFCGFECVTNHVRISLVDGLSLSCARGWSQ